MRHSQQHAPRVFRLTSSVGDCGTNDPKEVKIVQQKLVDAGYSVATGRHIQPDGRCNLDTVEAIRWYQRLLNLSPSGLITGLCRHWKKQPHPTGGPKISVALFG